MADILIDTCVFIDILRQKTEAIDYLKSLSGIPFISSLTCAELRAGARDDQEKNLINSILGHTQIIPVTEAIANQGGDIQNQYKGSHGVGLIDALIGSTALSENLPVPTLNKKHFPMVEVIKPY